MAAPASLSAIGTDAGTTGWAALLDGLVDAAARARLGRARLTIGRAGSPAARAWLRALIGVDRRIAGVDATEVAVLADELADWEADALAGPVRACFRLAEPPPEDETWRIRLGLQDADDPSAVVDATAVWTSRGELAGLGRQIAAPQETFLTELGKAARLYPQLDDALRTARPAVLELDPAGAHHFLREAAPTLVTAGFGVQLPGWWNKPSSRLGLKLTASTPSQPGVVSGAASTVGFDSIAAFRYDLAVGDDTLTAEELADLTAAKSGLVRLRGEWMELDARRLAAGLRIAGRTGEAPIGELLRLGLGLGATEDELPITEVTADGWLGELLAEHSELRMETDRAAGLVHRHAAPLSGSRPVLVAFSRPGRARWRARRRHGPGQDGPAAGPAGHRSSGHRQRRRYGFQRDAESVDLPDVAGRELAARGGEVHPGAPRARPSRRRTRPRTYVRRGGRGQRSGDHDVRAGRPGRRRAAQDQLAPGRRGRGPGDQERGHQAGHRDPLDPCRYEDRGHRHPGGEPAGRPLVDLRVRQSGPARIGLVVPGAVRAADRAPG